VSDDVRRAAVMASQPLVGTRAQGHGQGFDIQDLSISAIATSSATLKKIHAPLLTLSFKGWFGEGS